MRITLLATELLRTPACPGFGVSGDHKMSCFDRFARRHQVGRESGFWGDRGEEFERVQIGAVLVGLGAHQRHGVRSFERVQKRDGSARWRRDIPARTSLFERVQIGTVCRMPRAVALGTESLLRDRADGRTGGKITDPAAGSSFERVQIDLQSGPAIAGPTRAAGSFERVQMQDKSARQEINGAPAATPFERVQMTGVSVNGRAAMPPPK